MAINENQTEIEVLRVAAGLSVLRYVSAGEAVRPPTIHVTPRAVGQLDLVPTPGEPKNVLRAPGAAIVLVNEAEAELALTIIRHPESKSVAIELHLELLAPAKLSRALEEQSQDNRIESSSSTPSRMVLIGHLARRGDVLIDSGEWLGGPELPARIEGMEIRWPGMPLGLELEYAVTIDADGLHRLPPCKVNEFAGTRGRAIPIVGLALSLRGDKANSYRLKADCLFLGGQIISEFGRQMVLSGPTGREPLVGLRLWIEAATGSGLRQRSSTEAGRARIFPSSGPSWRTPQ